MKPGAYFMRFFYILFLFCACTSQAQKPSQISFNIEGFDEQVIRYEPEKREGVTEKDFKRGSFYLTQTQKAAQNDPEKLNVADYWNITLAFIALGESKELIEMAFGKAIEDDSLSICEYLNVSTSGIPEVIPEFFYNFFGHCGRIRSTTRPLDIETYITKHDFEPNLVRLIHQIGLDDQKYRIDALEKQAPLDRINRKLIDSLHEEYNTYIGESLVGPELDHVMCAVIQHSNLKYMERYLPDVHQASLNDDLSVTPLKMLLDRVQSIKYGYQFFGSQAGVPLATEEEREAVVKKYSLRDN